MKLIRIGFSLCVVFFFIQCTGTRPGDLGIREGNTLKPCPPTPNCVTSFCEKEDEVHYINPISFTGDSKTAWSKLSSVVSNQTRVKIIKSDANYLNAEFTSKLMRYVDDVEFLLDEKNKIIHVRSSSRLGRKDFGVNRERIEKIRSEFNKP